jgi:hypothetical protein
MAERFLMCNLGGMTVEWAPAKRSARPALTDDELRLLLERLAEETERERPRRRDGTKGLLSPLTLAELGRLHRTRREPATKKR